MIKFESCSFVLVDSVASECICAMVYCSYALLVQSFLAHGVESENICAMAFCYFALLDISYQYFMSLKKYIITTHTK